MLDLYTFLKQEYPEYIILFKSGVFYITFDNDAFVLYNLFHYKINNLKNNYKVGFPLSKLNQNIEYLSNKHINYIIIDNKNIVTKNKFKHNNYSKYMIDINIYNRINHIIDKLKSTNYNDLNTLLPRFEALLHDK